MRTISFVKVSTLQTHLLGIGEHTSFCYVIFPLKSTALLASKCCPKSRGCFVNSCLTMSIWWVFLLFRYCVSWCGGQYNFYSIHFALNILWGPMPSIAQYSTIFSFTITKCLNEITKYPVVCVYNTLIKVGNSYKIFSTLF